MFLGQSVTARRNWKKREESVWSGTYSRYHVLRFFLLLLRSYLISDVNAPLATSQCGILPQHTHTFPFNKNGETVVGVRGTHDEMIQRLTF